jgi:hypothetical protein
MSAPLHPVGLDPQECFVEVDEDRYMEDSIWVQVEVLDTIIVEKTFEEVARWESQPALHESHEHRDLVGVLLHRVRVSRGGEGPDWRPERGGVNGSR